MQTLRSVPKALFQQSLEVDIFFVIQMRKPRLRELNNITSLKVLAVVLGNINAESNNESLHSAATDEII